MTNYGNLGPGRQRSGRPVEHPARHAGTQARWHAGRVGMDVQHRVHTALLTVHCSRPIAGEIWPRTTYRKLRNVYIA